MEKREEALREALTVNRAETERWQTYQKDNAQAIENLNNFSKSLVVDVMVPLGSKAFSPGQLIHTNEVMVSHFQGYFSKCSAHTATKICEKRIQMAKDHLEKLKTEAELWSNKLEKPYLDGVLPSAEQREIIEDYDEEQEKLWREEHKRRVKEAKLREIEMRREKAGTEENSKSCENFGEMLDEAEQIEELKEELNNLQLEEEGDTEDILRRLLSGEIQAPPSKPRVAHSQKSDEVNLQTNHKFSRTNSSVKLENKDLKLGLEMGNKLSGIVKKSELEANEIHPTNNNYLVNPEILLQQDVVEANAGGGEESDDSADSEVPEEAKLIEEQAQFLPLADQIVFYQYQLQIVEQKLLTAPIRNATEIEKKLHLFKVRERLEELLEGAEGIEGAIELQAGENAALLENGETKEKVVTNGLANSSSRQQNKRISFALEDHTIEFRKTETVAEMLPKSESASVNCRDVIRLDEPLATTSKSSVESSLHQCWPTPVDRKQKILNKVEECLNYVAEQQSIQDFDLVNKIIESPPHTLHIHFKHSTQRPSELDDFAKIKTDAERKKSSASSIPFSPADIYRLFGQEANSSQQQQQQQPETVFVDAYEGEDQVKVPVLKEKDRPRAYKDLRMEFSKPRPQSYSVDSLAKPMPELNNTIVESSSVSKSILKNKNAVEAESHVINSKNNNKPSTSNKKKKKKPSSQQQQPPLNEDEYMSAYNKVMKEVVEKPSVEPDPLPEGRYIDAFAPKKRISRFKQIRSGIETT